MSLAPVPSAAGATCANCSAPLVADQRYCLSCGQPSSPVRLAFLDVLQNENQPQLAATTPYGPPPGAYVQVQQQPVAAPEWLRRYAPLLAVVSVLLLAMIVGLLVGHWVTQSKGPSTQLVRISGLPSAAAPTTTAAAAAPTTSTPTSTPSASSKQAPKSEAAEIKQEAKVEKQQAATAEKATPVKQTSSQAKKLGSSTGQKHQEEINALGAQPIETGG
jgi:hypothetical protein